MIIKKQLQGLYLIFILLSSMVVTATNRQDICHWLDVSVEPLRAWKMCAGFQGGEYLGFRYRHTQLSGELAKKLIEWDESGLALDAERFYEFINLHQGSIWEFAPRDITNGEKVMLFEHVLSLTKEHLKNL